MLLYVSYHILFLTGGRISASIKTDLFNDGRTMKEAMVGDTIFPADELLVTIPGTPVKSREEIERVAFPTRSVSREEIKTAFDAEVKRIADRFGSELYRSQHIFNCEMRRLCSLLPASAEIPTASRILLIVLSP